MTTTAYHMPNTLDALDNMVLTLKADAGHVLAPDALVRFEICMSEALANIVKYAQTTTPDAPIDITLTVLADTLLAEIFDPQDAEFFDLRDHANDLKTLDPLSENGRGLALILQCADGVDYGPAHDRIRLSLTFQR